MKNLYEIMENTSEKEKILACIIVELNEFKKNPDNFGMNEIDIVSEYLGADEEFINDQFELYAWSGDIIL